MSATARRGGGVAALSRLNAAELRELCRAYTCSVCGETFAAFAAVGAKYRRKAGCERVRKFVAIGAGMCSACHEARHPRRRPRLDTWEGLAAEGPDATPRMFAERPDRMGRQ